MWSGDLKTRVRNQVDFKEAGLDPPEVLKVMKDLSKEQTMRENDRHSNRRCGGKLMHAKGGELDANMGCKTPPGIPQETSGKLTEGRKGPEEQPKVQYLIAPGGVCFGCGRSGHHKKWCPT